jgi:hypothetical protein
VPVRLAEIEVSVPRTVDSVRPEEVGLSYVWLIVREMQEPDGAVPIVFEWVCVNN